MLAPRGQAPARHHLLLIDELTKIAKGENDRLMIMAPPGSAKSTYTSVLFPAWAMAYRPGFDIIGASYNAELAEDFSGLILKLVREFGATLGYGLVSDNRKLWRTDNGCSYRSVGSGGGITGRRADIVLIDDPLRGSEEADSKLIRDKIFNWYQSDVTTRLKPGARVVLVMTRWHADDLAGRLLRAADNGGDKWRVVSLPALAGANDPLGREPGEALWPEWEDVDALKRKRRAIGERHWSALFQQVPTNDEGAIIKRDWWQRWTDPVPGTNGSPKPSAIFISVDSAYTAKTTNDPSAVTIWHLMDARNQPMRDHKPGETIDLRVKILLRYAAQMHVELYELVEWLADAASTFAIPDVPLRMLIEGKASGLDVISELRRRLPGLPITQINPRGDKIARAHSVTALMEAGRVYALTMPDEPTEWRPWAETVIAECAAFPLGEHDDCVDSTTQCLRYIRDMGVELFAEDEVESAPMLEREALY